MTKSEFLALAFLIIEFGLKHKHLDRKRLAHRENAQNSHDYSAYMVE